jgi:hypothetical protein
MADDNKPDASDEAKAVTPENGSSNTAKKDPESDSATTEDKKGKKKPVKSNLTEEQIRAADAAVMKKMTVEDEKKALDEIITGDSTAAEKKEAIERLRELGFEGDILKKKTVDPDKSKGVDEIKKRASAARRKASDRILGQGYVSDADVHLERLADTFDKSARRWEMVVYPTMFAFILLAGYGFYLIYHLTHDIAVLSHSVTRMATLISDATPKVTTDMRNMSSDMQNMSGELNKMTFQMETLKPMSNNIASMTVTMSSLNRSVYGMQRDMGGLNRTVSGGPFGFMNDAMPFTSDSYKTPPPPLPMMGGQNPVYIQQQPQWAPQQQPHWGAPQWGAPQRAPQEQGAGAENSSIVNQDN